MSLERVHSEQLSLCENCGSQSLSSMVINGHVFCSSLCFTEWKWKRERREEASGAQDPRGDPEPGKEEDIGYA